MNFFEEATLRLKQQLRVVEDKEAAAALGLTGNAWTMRKRRGNFPETELYALCTKRPDLDLDPSYILTGKPVTVRERKTGQAVQDTLAPSRAAHARKQELTAAVHQDALLAAYRAATADGKRLIEAVAAFAATGKSKLDK